MYFVLEIIATVHHILWPWENRYCEFEVMFITTVLTWLDLNILLFRTSLLL